MGKNRKAVWFKSNPSDKIWWLDIEDNVGDYIFSFDKKKKFNMFLDYPQKLTPEQKEIFDKENPFWADYFRRRDEASKEG